MNKLKSFIYILLLVISSNAYYLGVSSYIGIVLLILINLLTGKLTQQGVFMGFLVTSLVLFNTAHVYVDGKAIDVVVYNFFLQLLFLFTLDFRNAELRWIFIRALQVQIFISAFIAFVGIITGEHSMFVDAGHAKGFSGLLALRGIYSTPQLMASICLAAFFLCTPHQEKRIPSLFASKTLSIAMLIFTINRVNLIALCLMGFLKVNISLKNKTLWQFAKLLSPLLGVVVAIISLQLLDYSKVNLQTIQSRLYLFTGVISEINFDSVLSVLFGDFSTIHFYIPQYQVDINYVENGFLFLFKYFGIAGLLLYIVTGCVVAIKIRKINFMLCMYAIFYLFIAQNFTNEFVSFVFPQVLFLLLSYPCILKGSQKENNKSF